MLLIKVSFLLLKITAGLTDEPHKKHTAEKIPDIAQHNSPDKPTPANTTVKYTDDTNVHVSCHKGHAADHDDHKREHENYPHKQIRKTHS